MRKFAASLAIACVPFFAATAQDVPGSAAAAVALPDKYIVSVPPAGLDITAPGKERTQTVNGTTYDVIAPIFNGSDGNISFVRLANANTTSTTFTLLVVGTPSGIAYGTATYVVPATASPQYSYDQIMQRAGVTTLAASDTGVSFYLRSTQFYTGYQHIIFNNNSRFFENVSRCRFVPNLDYSVLNNLLGNIHTSTVAALGFPATVVIHNNTAASLAVGVGVFSAETGIARGSFFMTLTANTTYALPFSYFEQQVGWSPTADQGQANLVFVPTGSSTTALTVGQAIYNQTLQSYVNMSLFCGSNY